MCRPAVTRPPPRSPQLTPTIVSGPCPAPRRRGLSDTAAALELPKSTVHGILHALEQECLVEHDTLSGTCGPGPEPVRLGAVGCADTSCPPGRGRGVDRRAHP
ncbi:helix-turn-helix domain-containing protein [Streptomyces sp. FL07-04A]|uniref:helix-turn-helix domain-containing protein n=1 Tax=Streptomyces sp. FL07-04A TaxID=3028658 RepID=UPI0039F681CE